MTNAIVWKALHDAWKRFDKSTAYGCRQRGIAFDGDQCARLWLAYSDTLVMHGYDPLAPLRIAS